MLWQSTLFAKERDVVLSITACYCGPHSDKNVCKHTFYVRLSRHRKFLCISPFSSWSQYIITKRMLHFKNQVRLRKRMTTAIFSKNRIFTKKTEKKEKERAFLKKCGTIGLYEQKTKFKRVSIVIDTCLCYTKNGM